MGFDGLLGNERIKENLTSALRRGRRSHFYLISGPEGSGKHTLARLLAAAMVCRESDPPCLRCSACRKVMEGVHPDFITVDDPEKKTVPVDLIRRAREDLFIRPNEADHKIYLFPRAQDMGLPGQNALLKVLEEPPGYGIFLLLVDQPDKLLSTVRSRCVHLPLQPLPEALLRRELKKRHPEADDALISGAIARSGGYLGQAQAQLSGESALTRQTLDFVEAFCRRDELLLVQTLVPMEKWKRDQLIPVLQQWVCVLQEALVCRSGIPALSESAATLAASRSGQELNQGILALKKTIEYAQGNVSPAAVCGYLQWALR